MGVNIQCASTSSVGLTFINNVIYDFKETGNTGTSLTHSAGFRINGGSLHSFYYNSVNVNGYFSSSDTNCYSSALLVGSVDNTISDLRNNVLSNMMKSSNGLATSQTYALYVPSNYVFTSTDNNCYYSENINILGYNGTVITNIWDWRSYTGQDYSSKSDNPLFYSDLSLIPVVGSPLQFSAAFLQNIQKDITDAQRGGTPTIGAYENIFSNALPSVTTNMSASYIKQFTAEQAVI